MDSENREPLRQVIRQEESENNKSIEKKAEGSRKILADKGSEVDPDYVRAFALAYAKYLAANNLTPEDIGSIPAGIPNPASSSEEKKPVQPARVEEEEPIESSSVTVDMTSEPAEVVDTTAEDAQAVEETPSAEPDWQLDDTQYDIFEEEPIEPEEDPKPRKKAKKEKKAKVPKEPREPRKPIKKPARTSTRSRLAQSVVPRISDEEIEYYQQIIDRGEPLARAIGSVTGIYDKARDGIVRAGISLGKGFIIESHRIISTYNQSRKSIGLAFLAFGIIVSVLLLVFDSFTVYEYAYNGKILGYVKNQDEVTDVLDVAGESLTENMGSGTEVKFVPNQNVTFNLVQAKGKSIDNADIAVNKLVYMTDIETEGYAVFDGDNIVAIVKSSEEADRLLNETKAELSVPDPGMVLESAEFTNELSVKPIEVLLTSVQSNADAKKTMIEGGELEIHHIIEQDETLETVAESFGVEPRDIYTDDNTGIATEAVQGDTVCVHLTVNPVSVKMVESGKMKEIIKFETIKKETDEYYQGDTFVEQEGVDGVQIFSGKITKVGGKVTKREESEPIEIITEKKDKIILVGTAEKPKTAPTGTFAMPLDNIHVTCEFGPRWGSTHKGIDLGAPTGTPIYASDGGTVIRAGWYGGYGNCIDIDHGRGYVTRYGHCSSIDVNVGDQVYQGQYIGDVGNTGFSFGSHLHFEVRENGVPYNPRPYLGM